MRAQDFDVSANFDQKKFPLLGVKTNQNWEVAIKYKSTAADFPILRISL